MAITTPGMDALEQKFSEYGIVLGFARDRGLDKILPEGYEDRTLYMADTIFRTWPPHHKHDISTSENFCDTNLTTPENPFILYDSNASFCTQFMAIGKDGRMMETHDGFMTYPIEHFDMRMARFKENADRQIGKDRLIVISGTNENHHSVDGYLNRAMSAFRDEDVALVVARSNVEQKIYTVPGIDYIPGFVYVPRYMSEDGMGHYMIIDNSTETHLNLMPLFVRQVDRK